MMIQLSVIIPTRNRAETLSTTLASIENQTLDQSLFEIIVCDNNSTDNTSVIANSFADKFQHFKYIKTLEPGLHVGRNKGFQEARGDMLVYADDDIEAFPEWLFNINEVFKDEEVMLVGGKNLPKWEVEPPELILEMWEPNNKGERILGYFSVIDLGDEIKEISPYYVFGCNFSVRKKIIAETNGFHPDSMPQEIIEYRGDGESAVSTYVQQKGYKTIYHPNASVYHLVPEDRLTINYLMKRSFNQGVSDSYVHIRNPKSTPPQKVFSVKSIMKKLLFYPNRFFKNKLKRSSTDTNIYYEAIREGYKEGYNFHHQKVKHSPELKSWVMKDNYL